ncbi:MAG: UdgX family uracil-DNA binding protein [Pseudoxanthomonas sp.]
MYAVALDPPWDPDAWRRAARLALRAGVPPDALTWTGEVQGGLGFGSDLSALPVLHDSPRVSAEFLSLANAVICHRDPHRHGLLYRLLWRIAGGEHALLERATDADVHRARELEKSVRRDNHKMKAFVRFREVPGEANAFVSWFEPQHYILDRVAPFFARRFAGMRWAILTPYRSAHWDGQVLSLGPGGTRADAPSDDAQEEMWRTYYANIFNPARLNPRMMRQEMPQKYWKLLPEAQLLPDLIRDAGQRVRDMAERMPEAPRRRIPLPPPASPEPVDDSLAALKAAASQCRRCPLWQPATQTVFGEGPEHARVMIVGEQPGDEEDLSGRPFVGPAGKLFTRAMDALGLDRSTFYITNAVKHFRFEQRGKFRLHRNPELSHVQACATWLERELASVRPAIVVCLGATAAQAIFGKDFRLMERRGIWHTLAGGTRAFATVHPSWVLRQKGDAQGVGYASFLEDLRLLQGSESGQGGAD